MTRDESGYPQLRPDSFGTTFGPDGNSTIDLTFCFLTTFQDTGVYVFRFGFPLDDEMQVILYTASELKEMTRRGNRVGADDYFYFFPIVGGENVQVSTWAKIFGEWRQVGLERTIQLAPRTLEIDYKFTNGLHTNSVVIDGPN